MVVVEGVVWLVLYWVLEMMTSALACVWCTVWLEVADVGVRTSLGEAVCSECKQGLAISVYQGSLLLECQRTI